MRDLVITIVLMAALMGLFSCGIFDTRAEQIPSEGNMYILKQDSDNETQEENKMGIVTAKDLAAAAERVARQYKTLYVSGCFGAPMTESNKQRYINHHVDNQKTDRIAEIMAASSDTFGFDCVCFLKALLWGWSGDRYSVYGGAKYCANGVPDIDDAAMMAACSDVSTDFSSIEVGEALGMPGHIGVYIGNGLAVECTHKWDNGVQITAVENMPHPAGYNSRNWTSHGKLPYVTYEKEMSSAVQQTCTVALSILRNGSKGENVEAMQRLLISYGYNCGSWGADGNFGAATENALLAFQEDMGLETDGICGPATWNALLGNGK